VSQGGFPEVQAGFPNLGEASPAKIRQLGCEQTQFERVSQESFPGVQAGFPNLGEARSAKIRQLQCERTELERVSQEGFLEAQVGFPNLGQPPALAQQGLSLGEPGWWSAGEPEHQRLSPRQESQVGFLGEQAACSGPSQQTLPGQEQIVRPSRLVEPEMAAARLLEQVLPG
jgi:hypothetical protein